MSLEADLRGANISEITGRILTAGAMNAHNTFDAPQTVSPVEFDGHRVVSGGWAVELPPKSVVVLRLSAG